MPWLRGVEVTVIRKTRLITKGVSVGAAALLAMQVFAGSGMAALPSANVEDQAAPTFYSPGNNPGLRSTFTNTDTSTLSKLFAKVQVFDASSIANVFVTKNGVALAPSTCTVEPGTLIVDCSFKTVRPRDVVRVALEVVAASTSVHPIDRELVGHDRARVRRRRQQPRGHVAGS